MATERSRSGLPIPSSTTCPLVYFRKQLSRAGSGLREPQPPVSTTPCFFSIHVAEQTVYAGAEIPPLEINRKLYLKPMKSFLLILLIIPSFCFSQTLTEFNVKRLKTDQRLMIGLGSWATVNFVAGGIGWATAPNEEMKSFHQMNVLWNTVNIALAIPGYIKAKRGGNPYIPFFESISAQQKTEKIFLINSGLDIGYISGGLLLRSAAKTNLEKRDQFNGFGNSLMIQGGFLLLFDMTAYFIHNQNRKNSLNPLIQKLQLSDTGLGIKWNLTASHNVKFKL